MGEWLSFDNFFLFHPLIMQVHASRVRGVNNATSSVGIYFYTTAGEFKEDDGGP